MWLGGGGVLNKQGNASFILCLLTRADVAQSHYLDTVFIDFISESRSLCRNDDYFDAQNRLNPPRHKDEWLFSARSSLSSLIYDAHTGHTVCHEYY